MEFGRIGTGQTLRVQTGIYDVPVKDPEGNQIGKVTKATFNYALQEFRVEMEIDDKVVVGLVPVAPFVAPGSVVAPDANIRMGDEER